MVPLRAMLAAGQDAGEFGEFDPHVVALTIRAVIDAASFYFTANPGLDIDHYVAEAVQLFDRATAATSAATVGPAAPAITEPLRPTVIEKDSP